MEKIRAVELQNRQENRQESTSRQYTPNSDRHIPTKVIVTAPEDAEVVVTRVNNEPVRLTIIGAQAYGERGY